MPNNENSSLVFPTQATPGYRLVQGTIEDKLVRKLKGPTDARGL